MNYFIFINQKAIIENGLNLDMKDAAILDFMRNMSVSKGIDKFLENNEVYFWMKSSLVIEKNPILGIKSPDGIYRRLLKLTSIGLVKPHPNNQKMNKSFYCLTEKFQSIFIEDSSQDLRMKVGRLEGTYGWKSEGGTDENRKVPTDENPDDYKNIINKYTKDNTFDFFDKKSMASKSGKDKGMYNFAKDMFMAIYEEEFKEKYIWKASDAGSVYPIISGIYEKMIEKNPDKEMTIGDVCFGIETFIRIAVKMRDGYFLKSFSVPNLYSKFNDIFLKINEKRNGKPTDHLSKRGVTNFKFNVPDPRGANG